MKETKISKQEQDKIIRDSLTAYFIERYWEFFEPEELGGLLSRMDLSTLSDGLISDNQYIKDVLPWKRLPRAKMTRILARLIDNGQYHNYKDAINAPTWLFSIKDIIQSIRRRPEELLAFGIDIKKVTDNEAYLLHTIGSEFFLENLPLEKYTFTTHQGFNIARTYNFIKEVVLKVDYKNFTGSHIAEVIKYTGEEMIEFFDLGRLASSDWVYVMETRPELFPHCQMKTFDRADVFDLVRLSILVNEEVVHEKLLERDLGEITAYGWELLLIHHMGRYKDLCNYKILEKNNIVQIKKAHPLFTPNTSESSPSTSSIST